MGEIEFAVVHASYPGDARVGYSISDDTRVGHLIAEDKQVILRETAEILD